MKLLLYRELLSKPHFDSDAISTITVPDKRNSHHHKNARPNWNVKSPYFLNSKLEKGLQIILPDSKKLQK